jgi:anti-sigma factor (TIGR02949 family)
MTANRSGRIDCEEAIRRLAEYLDRELEAAPRASVEEHLEVCRSCYSRAEFEQRLRSSLRRLSREPVRPAFEERICDLASGFAAETETA